MTLSVHGSLICYQSCCLTRARLCQDVLQRKQVACLADATVQNLKRCPPMQDAPDRGSYVPKQACNILQERALMLMVCLARKAPACLMLCAQ